MRFAFIQAESAYFPIAFMCNRFNVSKSGYYAWRKRKPCKREVKNQMLAVKIMSLHKESRGCYGSPRITQDLLASGQHVSRKRVARIMREMRLTGRPPRRRTRTTDSRHSQPVAENIIARNFTANGPNQRWAADISTVRTWEGWLYLAVVIDLFSRRIVGWAIADHMRKELVIEALNRAMGQRLPGPGCIHHSDRGAQYASVDYQKQLSDGGLICSMSRKGNCWDNSVVESFFATLKMELIYRHSFATRVAARHAIVDYIVCFYNSKRRHSTLGYVSPMEYELVRRQEKIAA